MNNKIVDKRDLVINQAEEILLNKLKDHKNNEFCAYVYHELTHGEGIEQRHINRIKDNVLTADGAFKVRRNKKNEHYSMDDLLNLLIYCLSRNLEAKAFVGRAEEIVEKYGLIVLFEGVECYLKEVLFGIKEEGLDEYYNDFEKMIEEYILRA